MSALKVTLLIRHLNPPLGGLEKQGWKIAQGFQARGAEVHILTTTPVESHPHIHPLILFHSLPLKKQLNFRQIKAFDNACKRWHLHNPSTIIFGMDRTCFQTHIRAGNGVHAAYLEQKKIGEGNIYRVKARLNPLNHALLKIEKEGFESPHLKMLFTNSHMVKKQILHFYNTPEEKIQVIHNGVEWHEMDQDFQNWREKKAALCDKLGLNPSTYHFLFIGNGYKRKGLVPLLHTLSTLPFRDFHLSVIGKDKHLSKFMALSKKLALQDQVSFFGPRPDVRSFYQVGDALVIPSFYDPFANVTVEALAMGLYVVSSSFNGGHEILNQTTGTLILNLLDKAAFTHALMRAVDHPKTWERSQQIRSAVKHLDFSKQLSTLINLTLR